jgi:hypothetical protein
MTDTRALSDATCRDEARAARAASFAGPAAMYPAISAAPHVTPRDHAILKSLIALAEKTGAKPHAAFDHLLDLASLGVDLHLAHARPADGVRLIGDAELILFIAMRHLAGSPATAADLMRFTSILQTALPMVRDHLFAAFVAEQRVAP